MKKIYILVMGLMLMVFSGFSQMSVHQVLVGSGGIYGNDVDHVMISGVNPDDLSSTDIGEVNRESIQDMIVVGDFAYVAAEDSLVKFDLQSNTKIVSVYESNLSRLYSVNDQLYVSRRSDVNGAPADGIYLKSYDLDLNYLASANGISTDAAGMLMVGDSLYIAVSGDWQATEGALAVATSDLSFMREINLGADAVGIYDLFAEGDMIYSVNKSPYGATTGSITVYETPTATWTTNVFDHIVGKAVSKVGSSIYLLLDYGIGSYNIDIAGVDADLYVPDPGSANYIAIAGAAFDSINNLFYVSITDYFSFGEGKVYDMSANQTGSFDAGVSAEVVAIQYADETVVHELMDMQANVYPNPVSSMLYIDCSEQFDHISVYNELGALVKDIPHLSARAFDMSDLPNGFYMVKMSSATSFVIKKIQKN